jgi:hypothetical protein
MRRLLEFLPLLLVGVVLAVFQLSRMGTTVLPFEALQGTPPTPAATVVPVAAPRTATPIRSTPLASVQPAAARCTVSQPRFVGGMATLKAALGATMGDPIECEHGVSTRGDTEQKTSSGLAYYQHELNLACFTTGWEHWAWTERGLVTWSGEAVDPPPDAVVVTP